MLYGDMLTFQCTHGAPVASSQSWAYKIYYNADGRHYVEAQFANNQSTKITRVNTLNERQIL